MKWQALSDANQAAYREPSTLPLGQAIEQFRRDYKLMESMYVDATSFIGRLLGTGDPYSAESDSADTDVQT